MTIVVSSLTMGEPEQTGPLEWKHPDQVMRLHRLKMKKCALQARMNGTVIGAGNTRSVAEDNAGQSGQVPVSLKRKNPFAKDDSNKKQKNTTSVDLEASNDNSLFQLLRIERPPTNTSNTSADNSLSFVSVLSKLESGTIISDLEVPKGEKYIPMDWTLNTKMRFMSPKPFPWNGKLKTSEEASGTTGFVRCLDIGEEETTLDTSPNARFHRCCMVWQHPSLPWLDLFPRSAGKVSAGLASNSAIANNQFIKDALYREWSDSFRSLFHLLRARQCSYFYVCANTFTVLFRAAGICGLSEVHAFLTPTTRGFRQSLKQEEIDYTMPLRKESKRRSDTADSGCDISDFGASNMSAFSDQEKADNHDDEEDEPDAWLQSLGVEKSEIRRINSSQARMVLDKESDVDNMRQSLIFVKGVEAQALFNFLINCKSATATTGVLSGVPPTLLAPTAFHGATLKPLKVKDSIVRLDRDRFYSLEIKGPILPHVLPSLCRLIKSSQLGQYSVSCAQVATTTAFSAAKHGQGQASTESKSTSQALENVFGQENLSDCGFDQDLLSHFCCPDAERIRVLESLKFSNNLYTWS